MSISYQIILILFSLIISGCNIVLPYPEDSSIDYYILITPSMNDNETSLQEKISKQAQELNIQNISITEVDTHLSDFEKAIIIYIYPNMIQEIEKTQLQDWYKDNKLLVGLNTSASEMAKMLGLSKTRQDLDLAILPEDHIFASSYQLRGTFVKSDFYSDLHFLHMENQVWLSKFK